MILPGDILPVVKSGPLVVVDEDAVVVGGSVIETGPRVVVDGDAVVVGGSVVKSGPLVVVDGDTVVVVGSIGLQRVLLDPVQLPSSLHTLEEDPLRTYSEV